jgi:mannonate dehydratase
MEVKQMAHFKPPLVRDGLALPSGMKIALQMPADPAPEDFQLAHGLGVQYATAWIHDEHAAPEDYAGRRAAFAAAGLTLYGLGNGAVHNQDDIVLNLPERDAKIEAYKRHLRHLAAARIPYTTYAHMANGIWSTARETSRGASARAYDHRLVATAAGTGSAVGTGTASGRAHRLPLTHGRPYTQAEMWDNYTTFIRAVAPVAEEVGVLIGIHPDDPPGLDLGGVPRCIFSSFDGYERALEIADSPNVGLCLGVGCWLEGGPRMGRGVLETIRHFGGQGKIFKVHFRNVDAPLPHFVETFLNNGYMDMRQVMQALQQVGFDGVIIPDHVPHIGADPRVANAYTIGYMQALLAGLE